MAKAKKQVDVEDDERCTNYIGSKSLCRPDEDNPRRCPDKATHYLMNGPQVNGRVCSACAECLTREFSFVTVKRIA